MFLVVEKNDYREVHGKFHSWEDAEVFVILLGMEAEWEIVEM